MADTTIAAMVNTDTNLPAALKAYADALNAAQAGIVDDSNPVVIALFAVFLKTIHDLNEGAKGTGVRSRIFNTFGGPHTQYVIEFLSSHANKVLAELTAAAGGTAPGYAGAYDPAHADWGGPDGPVN